MGIPLFFKTLSEKYDDSLIEEIDNTNKFFLFLDMNCLIHPCCRKVLDDDYSNTRKFKYEQRMLNEIKTYLKLVIEYCNPDFIYMAIDGVAPCAKMTQQRLRRFKTILEKKEINKIKTELNMEYSQESWDTNAISPGTDFMINLTKSLDNFIKTDKVFKNKKVILSGPNIPGEGEHKILSYIKENDIDCQTNIGIYGLDADLIMLALASSKDNIYLVREAIEFGQPRDGVFMYMDIDQLKCNIIEDFKERFYINSDSFNSDKLLNDNFLVNLIDDYIFICFLLGNDFIPHIFTLDLRNDGLNIIMEAYIKTYNNLSKNLINNDYTINFDFFKSFICLLSEKEDKIAKTIFEKRKKFRKYFKIRSTESEFDRRKEVMNNYPILNMEDELNITNESLYCHDWRKRYYKQCFNFTRQVETDMVCKKYMEGLLWTFDYYFKGCGSWRWNYNYSYGPTIKDIYNFIKDMDSFDGLNPNSKTKTKPVSPITQLVTILPKNSINLIPPVYHKLMKEIEFGLLHYYPEEYTLETIFKRYYWQCVPLLPPIDLDLIEKNVNKIKVSKEIKERFANGVLLGT